MEQAAGDSADIAPRHAALRRCIVYLAVYYAVAFMASSVWMVLIVTFAGPADPAERLVFGARFGLGMLLIGGLLVLVIWYVASVMLRFVSWLSAREERSRSATAGLVLVRIAVLLLLAQPVMLAIAGMTIFATICVGGCTGPAEPPPGGSSPREVRTLDLGGGAELALVWIPPGEDVLGSPADQEWQLFDEGPQRTVRFEEGFWIGRYEVTQAQWEAVMGANPSGFAGNPDRPVEQVSWPDCQAFVEKLNALLGTEGFALPDEEEWEYACRAETDTWYYFGEDRDEVSAHAWFIRNSGQQTHPVGGKLANPWGLYDMYGNVAEWCTNALAPPSDATRAGMPAEFDLAQYRITRGGSWFGHDQIDCRSASRSAELLDERSDRVGLRVIFRGKTLPEGEESPRAS